MALNRALAKVTCVSGLVVPPAKCWTGGGRGLTRAVQMAVGVAAFEPPSAAVAERPFVGVRGSGSGPSASPGCLRRRWSRPVKFARNVPSRRMRADPTSGLGSEAPTRPVFCMRQAEVPHVQLCYRATVFSREMGWPRSLTDHPERPPAKSAAAGRDFVRCAAPDRRRHCSHRVQREHSDGQAI